MTIRQLSIWCSNCMHHVYGDCNHKMCIYYIMNNNTIKPIRNEYNCQCGAATACTMYVDATCTFIKSRTTIITRNPFWSHHNCQSRAATACTTCAVTVHTKCTFIKSSTTIITRNTFWNHHNCRCGAATACTMYAVNEMYTVPHH